MKDLIVLMALAACVGVIAWAWISTVRQNNRNRNVDLDAMIERRWSSSAGGEVEQHAA